MVPGIIPGVHVPRIISSSLDAAPSRVFYEICQSHRFLSARERRTDGRRASERAERKRENKERQGERMERGAREKPRKMREPSRRAGEMEQLRRETGNELMKELAALTR